MTSQRKNIASAVIALAAAVVLVFGFNVDLFFWFDDPQALESPATTSAVVVNVIDGDTFTADIGTTTESVRLIGIDTPEITWPSKDNDLTKPEAECFGWEAREALQGYVSDREVVLAADARQPTRDVYDRLLAYVYVSGELVNEALLAGGFARELTVGAGYEKTKEFKRAQAVAREGEAGLWAACD